MTSNAPSWYTQMRFPAGGTINSSGELVWISFPSTRKETGQWVVASCLRSSSIVMSHLAMSVAALL